MIPMVKRAAIIILDGWGHGKDPKVSAISQANTPFVDSLYHDYTNAELVTFGEDVGLPEGQMGNSEVGHLNIGAGRVVYQELARINVEIREQKLEQNEVLKAGIAHAKATNKSIHLLGLLSDGGVHSHINHLLALCDILKKEDVTVYIHAFLDGRDTDPNGGLTYLQTLMNHIKGSNARMATVVGRYYAMDRDNRWERVKIAYDLLVNGEGRHTEDILASVGSSYQEGITDEFMQATQYVENGFPVGNIKDGDTVLFFNYRTDRPRELTKVLSQEDVPDYGMCKLDLYYMTMTNYDSSFKGIHIIYDKDNLLNTIGQVIESNGLSQVRIAETEKYPHVTFFFNGGREIPFDNEHRILVPSPKVSTYDLQPEMSAIEVTNLLMQHIDNNHPDFVCLNYANTDMVGHTGVFEAAVEAAETVDKCLANLIPYMLDQEYNIIMIADHGNSDIMVNPDGSPHTAHTTNLVPVFFITKDKSLQSKKLSDGKLGDIAPTILNIMNLDAPAEMDGKVLLH